MEISLQELGTMLEISTETIERWIRQGRIPVQLHGEKCFFGRSLLEKWAHAHNIPFKIENVHVESEPSQPESKQLVLLNNAFKTGDIFYDLKGENCACLLQNAVSYIPNIDEKFKPILYEKLIERENICSTGIGRGIAIPHPSVPLDIGITEPMICTFFLSKPVNYGAADRKPVFILFILLCLNQSLHLHLLSRLSFCIRSDEFLMFLKNKPKKEELISNVYSIEQHIE
ncbi:MAG: PTS sugar transporter subunit IIA [Desulfobacterales bacterium]|nr:PTS sugar transporter subunit IIA [Desulfobacterales bacterium]